MYTLEDLADARRWRYRAYLKLEGCRKIHEKFEEINTLYLGAYDSDTSPFLEEITSGVSGSVKWRGSVFETFSKTFTAQFMENGYALLKDHMTKDDAEMERDLKLVENNYLQAKQYVKKIEDELEL